MFHTTCESLREAVVGKDRNACIYFSDTMAGVCVAQHFQVSAVWFYQDHLDNTASAKIITEGRFPEFLLCSFTQLEGLFKDVLPLDHEHL